MLKLFKKKTLLNGVSCIEAKEILYSIIDDAHIIMSNDNLTKSIKACFGENIIPQGKTPKQYFKEIDGDKKLADFFKSIMDYAYEPALRILAKIFCTPYEKYCKKTLEDVCKDLMKFIKSKHFGFFMSAIISPKAR